MRPTVLVISAEHAVNTLPDAYAHLFHSHEALLQTHRAVDFGTLDITHHLGQTLACDHFYADVTSLLIDCNRSLTHPHCFSEFTKSLSSVEKKKIAEHYYHPYRQKAETLIQHHIQQGYQVLHVSCHSFPPTEHNLTHNAGIGLLYDPTHHGEKEVVRQWENLLSQQGKYRIRLNYPYNGTHSGFTTELRKHYPEQNYLGVTLEINQILIQEKSIFDDVKEMLSSSLSQLLELL